VLLFAAAEPLSLARLVELLERPAPARVQAALEALAASMEAAGLPLVVQKVAGAWRLLSDPELAPVVARLRSEPKPERISAAALETLAIIAYRQPVSKAEIEAIRGVQAGPVLRSLVDRGLVRISGRAELPGQPLLYGTTKDFLERFGLGALKDLPRDGELNED
jgi:segregation and condensation protein B